MALTPLEHVLDYIEEHLDQTISLGELADLAGYSKYHFDRLFRYTVGEPLIEYVRKRKLTEASIKLLQTNLRQLDIAMSYGFQSQQSFTMAFKKHFQVTPGQYRKKGNRLILLEKHRYEATEIHFVHRLATTEPTLIEKENFVILGLEYFGANQNNEIPLLWDSFFSHIEGKLPVNAKKVYYGVCDHVADYDPLKSEFSYFAGIEIDVLSPSVWPPLDTKTVGKQLYLVFTHYGNSETLENTYRYIYGTYLSHTPYVLLDAPDFERYDERYDPASEHCVIEIYIPVAYSSSLLDTKSH